MNKFRNLKIRTKMTAAFMILILIMLGMSSYAIMQISLVNSDYTRLINVSNAKLKAADSAVSSFLATKVAIGNVVIYTSRGNFDAVESNFKDIEQQKAVVDDFLPGYRVAYNGETREIKNKLPAPDELEKVIGEYYEYISQIQELASQYRVAEAIKIIDEALANKASTATGMLNDILDVTLASAQEQSDALDKVTDGLIIALIAITAAAFAVSGGISMFVSSVIGKSVKQIGDAARRIASGDLGVNPATNDMDEIGVLSRDFAEVVSVFNRLGEQILKVDSELETGDIDAVVDEKDFEGDYKKLAHAVNELKGSLISEVLILLSVIDAFAVGDFTKEAPALPGKKAVLSDTLNKLRSNLISVSGDISGLIEDGRAGKLNARIDSTSYSGDWKKISEGLNMLLAAFVQPIQETIGVLGRMAEGDLKARVEGGYSGEFAVMKQAINTTLSSIQGYVAEISRVLDLISNEDINISVKMEFIGDFGPIKDSLNKIIDSLNGVMSEINNSAEQVAAGARLISESSMSLAQGAAEQSSSIEQLTVTIDDISRQTAKNAEDAENANKLALSTVDSAEQGNKEMKDMLNAMTEINEATNSISKVIKTIEDIAFQTNLLALNAAVEAARAGQHGKGFGVVAEQVRALATRSQDAAKETTGLIESSFYKAQQGSEIANHTAETLSDIVRRVNEISQLIGGVAKASGSQRQAVEAVSGGINQISQVTQANTATSEEEAASSQELSSQAETFKNMVAKFKLRGGEAYKKMPVRPERSDFSHSVYSKEPDEQGRRESVGFAEPNFRVPEPSNVRKVTLKPVQNTVTKPVQYMEAKPIQNTVSKPVKHIEGKPIQSTVTKPVKHIEGKPIQSTVTKPAKVMEGKPVQSTAAKTIQNTALSDKPSPKAEAPVISRSAKPGAFSEVSAFSDYNAPNYGKY